MTYADYLEQRIHKNGIDWARTTCQQLTIPSYANAYFETVAFTGEQLFNMPKEDARLVGRLVFSIRCELSFGIKIVT